MDGISTGFGTDGETIIGGEVCWSLGAGLEVDSCDGMLKKSAGSAEGEVCTGFVKESGWS